MISEVNPALEDAVQYLHLPFSLCFQAQIDQYVGLIRTQVNSVVGK